jgi:hypothetical protein
VSEPHQTTGVSQATEDVEAVAFGAERPEVSFRVKRDWLIRHGYILDEDCWPHDLSMELMNEQGQRPCLNCGALIDPFSKLASEKED